MTKKIIEEQRIFFASNTTKNLNFRISQLQKLKAIITENQNQLDEAIYADFKKSKFETRATETFLLLHDINEACRNLKQWARKKKVKNSLINFPGKSYITPEPLGTCLVIGAWNYPYQLSLAPAIAALAAGNTVILKPSEISSNTSRVMAEIINQNFDPRIFRVIEGGVRETIEILQHKYDKIFFTGSTAVGKLVYQAAAERLTPVTLELGGKSPAFITKDCNLKMSVKRLIFGKFLNAGQTCIAPDYVLVHSSAKDQFLQIAKDEIKKSHFSTDNHNYVQIINERNFDRLVSLLDNNKVFCGGGHNKELRHIEPTILSEISFDDKVMQEEIFGPILPVIEYDNLDDTISKVKDKEKPLACYIFTNDNAEKNKILDQVSFGGGSINDVFAQFSNSKLPFGGVGHSGMGSYHGKYGFDTFSHHKSIAEKANWFESSLKHYPHTDGKLKWIKRMLT